jgi:hypothetical protein
MGEMIWAQQSQIHFRAAGFMTDDDVKKQKNTRN